MFYHTLKFITLVLKHPVNYSFPKSVNYLNNVITGNIKVIPFISRRVKAVVRNSLHATLWILLIVFRKDRAFIFTHFGRRILFLKETPNKAYFFEWKKLFYLQFSCYCNRKINISVLLQAIHNHYIMPGVQK